MSEVLNDYAAARLALWNKDPQQAVLALDEMSARLEARQLYDDDRDLLAIDWRGPEEARHAAAFVTHVGLETTEAGLPIHQEGSFVRFHKTGKNKLFFDFEMTYKKVGSMSLHVVERRIVLPNEGHTVVASLFRAGTKSIRQSK